MPYRYLPQGYGWQRPYPPVVQKMILNPPPKWVTDNLFAYGTGLMPSPPHPFNQGITPKLVPGFPGEMIGQRLGIPPPWQYETGHEYLSPVLATMLDLLPGAGDVEVASGHP